MAHKILLLGAQGFIGARLKEGLNCQAIDARINSFEDAQDEIKKYRPEILINCIGHTGKNNVDGCELDKDKTLTANSFVPIMLAEAALRNQVRFIHISSGCIYHYDYSKDQPIEEEKRPDFFELFYSRSKIYAELPLENLSRKYNILIVRIRVPLDNRPHPKNLLDKLIKYKNTVVDVPNSVSYVPDFIIALRHLIDIGARGTYNVVNKGALRYPEILDVYKKYQPGFEYKVVDFSKINMVRTNLIMSTEKLERSGFKVRDIHEVLDECVKSYLR